MGNSHSQQHQLISGHQWTHSYPRTKHIQPQVKVLPERLPPLRLRTTDNGAILQNGGTISARKQSLIREERVYRPRSSSAHRAPNLDEMKGLDRGRYGSEPDLRFHLREARDQYGENAVRQRISRSRKKYKAPPAPPPANGISSGVESSSSDMNGWESNSKDCCSGQSRKARLFKTRAETSKKNAGSGKKLGGPELEKSKSTEALNVPRPAKYGDDKPQHSTNGPEKDRMAEKKGLKRSVSHEVISMRKSLATPEFQAELLEAAQRLRPAGQQRQNLMAGLKTSKPTVPRDEVDGSRDVGVTPTRQKSHSNCRNPSESPSNHNAVPAKDDGFGKPDKCQSHHQPDAKRDKPETRDVPSKKFYFGMEGDGVADAKPVNKYISTNNVDKTNAEHRITAVEKSKNLMNLYKSAAESGHDWEDAAVDKFAANFKKAQNGLANGNTTSCSSSFVSDPDEDVDGGIALHLRPTLPKKQLEIPRFSPTAAWRLLSSIDTVSSQAPSPSGSDDSPVLLEDRIHPPASQQALRNSHDKSADSGISGDASPGGCPESSSEVAATPGKPLTSQNTKNLLMAWTPEQDLEEETSSDDLESPVNSSKNAVSNIPGAKFSPRGQLFLSRDHSFSMSLPREDRMCLYPDSGDAKERTNGHQDPTFRLNSLQKLKVALGTSKRNEMDDRHQGTSDNWVLSRSVPSSLNNSHIAVARSGSNPSSPEQDDEYGGQTSLKYPSYSYLAYGGRMMYLPEYHSRMSPDIPGKKHARSNIRGGFLSKSCENIMQTEMKQVHGRSRTPSPVPGHKGKSDSPLLHTSSSTNPSPKKKKFTFQSTVRMLENRRIAERLSREAEFKENQRLSEVEAMKKVEEEFQKKRAREKASIRHQLRLFSLEEKNYSSLPAVEWDDGSRMKANPSPPSSGPQSQPSQTNGLTNGLTNGARKLSSANRKTSTSSESNKFASSTQILSEYREQIREYRDYRHPRYTEPQPVAMENNRRSIVEHPKMVYDMPKSTAVYVTAPVGSTVQNLYKEDGRNGVSTPRSSSSDNYRKGFAHGALVNGGRSLNSSDSELSQSHVRSACQPITSRRLNALHRSRSTSLESVSRSASPQKSFDPFASPPRSRSTSPIRIHITEKRRQRSPDRDYNEAPDYQNINYLHPMNYKTPKSLERKLSNPGDYHSTFNSHRASTLERSMEISSPQGKPTSSTLIRLGVPSLQPFNKSEKSYRPINFNPVINKLAQTVN